MYIHRNKLLIAPLFYIFCFLIFSVGLTSCLQEDPEIKNTDSVFNQEGKVELPLKEGERTLLLYVVASNNLESDWWNDRNEILTAASRLESQNKDFRIAVYAVTRKDDTAGLYLLAKKDDVWDLHEVKSYSRDVYSTDPSRFSEVVCDVREMMPSRQYGLILWSHATGWTPFLSQNRKVMKSFGSDFYNGIEDRMDITELSAALPDSMFDYVWFDCCYMGAVEVAYEIAPKVPRMVGYLSEVWSEGIPYDLILPYLVSEEPDLQAGASKLADYFKSKNMAYSVGYYDLRAESLKSLPALFAEVVRKNPTPEFNEVQSYHRRPFGPFYDLGNLVDVSLDNTGDDNALLRTEFKSALDDIVLFKDCHTRDFDHKDWNPAKCSGMTVHFPGSCDEQAEELFYRSTRWGHAVSGLLY